MRVILSDSQLYRSCKAYFLRVVDVVWGERAEVHEVELN